MKTLRRQLRAGAIGGISMSMPALLARPKDAVGRSTNEAKLAQARKLLVSASLWAAATLVVSSGAAAAPSTAPQPADNGSRTVFLLSPSRWLISRYDCPSLTSFSTLGAKRTALTR
jgi:hypothetical protein